MKKQYVYLLMLAILSAACASDDSSDSMAYDLERAENTITWTAYKTTGKVPVEGSFSTIEFTAQSQGHTVREALDQAQFSIPVSALLAGGKEYNIIHSFFGAMIDTDVLNGRIEITDEQNGYVLLTMNGIEEKLPFAYTIASQQVEAEAIMDLRKWQVSEAMAELNKACGILHQGGDGIIKVWDEVSIKIATSFQ